MKSINELIKKPSALYEEISKFNFEETVSVFAALLTCPETQSNTLVLETLVHLSVNYAKGDKQPNPNFVSRFFQNINHQIGHLQDPSEEMFVSIIYSPRGNFRVIEGIWADGVYYLQRIINVIEGIPKHIPIYDSLRNSVYALLTVSELMCSKSTLEKYQLGNEIPERILPKETLQKLSSLKQRVFFSLAELEKANISVQDLKPFILDQENRQHIFKETIGHTTLERYPILLSDRGLILSLPTAISVAIRRCIFEEIKKLDQLHLFVTQYTFNTIHECSHLPLLIKYDPKPDKSDFVQISNESKSVPDVSPIFTCTIEADVGFYVNLIFVFDNLGKFEHDGFIGYAENIGDSSEVINKYIKENYNSIKNQQGFREGISLLIMCGIGRGLRVKNLKQDYDHWHILSMTLPDFYYLASYSKVNLLSFFEIIHAQQAISKNNIHVMNLSGFFNLLAWMEENKGSILPVNQIVDNKPHMISIPTNCLRSLKQKIICSIDKHAERYLDGEIILVQKNDSSYFEENDSTTYLTTNINSGAAPIGLFKHNKTNWWHEIIDSQSTISMYERWNTVSIWIKKSAPILAKYFLNLPTDIFFSVCFKEPMVSVNDRHQSNQKVNFDDICSDMTINIVDNKKIEIFVGGCFLEGLNNSKNISEKAFVYNLIFSLSLLLDQHFERDEIISVLQEIVPNDFMRQQHAFSGKTRHYILTKRSSTLITPNITLFETMKIGLAWQAIEPSSKKIIFSNKNDCTTFLNKLIRSLEKSLCSKLSLFAKEDVIQTILNNYECASGQEMRWSMTTPALLTMYANNASAPQVITKHLAKIYQIYRTSRIILEAAVCECPQTSTIKFSKLDLLQLMVVAEFIFLYGGDSNAIQLGTMEAFVRVTPLGDVHINNDVIDNVYMPYTNKLMEGKFEDSFETYHHYVEMNDRANSGSEINQSYDFFTEAWQEQFGFSLEEFIIFRGSIEQLAYEEVCKPEGNTVIKISKNNLINFIKTSTELTDEKIVGILEQFIFPSRDSWNTIPSGYENKDRFPWAFRRRLSILRKPILEIQTLENHTLLVISYSEFDDAMQYIFKNMFYGYFPHYQLCLKMKQWAGKQAEAKGAEFSKKVSLKLQELGWETESEIKITQILNRGLEKDYGDVDVLAWNTQKNIILIIECKNLQFNKTLGEVAEQLSDFLGEIKNDGKSDDLLKHLNRVNVLSKHIEELKKYLKLRTEVKLESLLVFSNPVPMMYSLAHMRKKVQVLSYKELETLETINS